MTSNLDKLAEIAAGSTGRQTRTVSFSVHIKLANELERLSEELGLPRSSVLQAILRDAFTERNSRPYLDLIEEVADLESDGTDPFSCEAYEAVLALFDPDTVLDGMTMGDAKVLAEARIKEIREEWSL